MTTKSDHLLRLKIISLGNVTVGKSCLIKRYCEKRFVSKYMATIGIDYGVTRLHVRNYDIRMNIFDFSGHPLFYEVRNEFYRDVQGILLVFDVSNRRSFDTLEYWLCEMKKELNLTNGQKSPVVIFVVGNKNDLKRAVDEGEAKLWANVRGYQYFETSGLCLKKENNKLDRIIRRFFELMKQTILKFEFMYQFLVSLKGKLLDKEYTTFHRKKC